MNFSLLSLKNKVSALSLGKDDNYLQSIVEDICLQMPTYHSGVLVAYSTNYVSSTALQKDIKFSWYRSGFKREELEVVDDSSNRPWYIPSADDIGFKICVQCEDMFDKGFNRYRESTVIRADPLLCSSVEAAVANTFYETNDLCLSIGNTLKSSTDLSSEAFDARLRHSALSSRACFFGCDMPAKFRAEVTEAGLMLCPAIVGEDGAPLPGPPTYSTAGLLIKASNSIKVTCNYPVCCVISIPLAEEDRSVWDAGVNGNGSATAPGGAHKKGTNKQAPWLWLGLDGSPLQVGFNRVLAALPHNPKHELLISIACADRNQRDTIALISRNLCTSCTSGDSSSASEQRLARLPWNSVVLSSASPSPPPSQGGNADGTDAVSTRAIGAEVAPGYDSNQLMAKIKQLEVENAQLRKTRHQLALRQAETDSKPAGVDSPKDVGGASSDSESASGGGAMHQELQTLQAENEKLAQSLADAKKEYEKASIALRHTVEELSYEATAKDQSLEVMKRQLAERQTDSEAVKQQANFEKLVSQQKFKQLQEQLDRDIDDRESLTKELNQKDLELQSLTEEVKCVLRDCNVLKKELREEQNKVYNLQEEHEQLEGKLVAAEEYSGTLQLQRESLTAELAECKAEGESLKAANQELIVEQKASSTEIVALRVEKDELKSNKDATVLLTAEQRKSEQFAMELNQYRKKNDSLSRELKRVLKDLKDSQQGLEARLKSKTQECEELEIQLANALTAISAAQPTDLIPNSPMSPPAEGGDTGADEGIESELPAPANGISALLNAGRRRTSATGPGDGEVSSNSQIEARSAHTGSMSSMSSSMHALLPPPQPVKTTQLLNPHSAPPLKPVTPTKMSTSLGIAANGMLRSTSNTVRSMLMLSGNSNSSSSSVMPPRPQSQVRNVGVGGVSNAARDDDTHSNSSNHSDDSNNTTNSNRNSLDDKLSSYYADTDQITASVTGEVGQSSVITSTDPGSDS